MIMIVKGMILTLLGVLMLGCDIVIANMACNKIIKARLIKL